MFSKSEQIQFHYECAMAIGTSLDLTAMLRTSLKTIMRKLNCPACGIQFFEQDSSGLFRTKKILSIPRNTGNISGYSKAIELIPTSPDKNDLDKFYKSLPLSGETENGFFYILELPDLGVLILMKNSGIDSVFLKSMGPILQKLAVAIKACLQNSELINHKENQQKLIEDKTRELTRQNTQLLKEIENRGRYEKALHESKEKYRELVENANSIILRWNRNGEITFFNEYAQNFFGFTEEEIIGKHVVGTIVPETESTGKDLRGLMSDICSNPQKYEDNVNENIRKDGSRVWIAWTNKVLTDEDGNLEGILSIGLDVTEQRATEQRFKLTAEATSDLIYEWDVYRDSLTWFGDIDGALGYEQGEIKHDLASWISIIHPEDQKRLSNAVQVHRTETNPINYEYRMRRKDGSWSHWTDFGMPILNLEGKPVRWIGACKDISDRKETEAYLIESEARYRALFTNEVDAICIFEADTSIMVDVNDAWINLYGYELDEIIGKSVEVMSVELDQTRSAVKKTVTSGTLFVPKRHHRKKDGTTFFVEISAGTFSWQGKTLVFGIIRDITERINSEERLKESEKLLAETQKIAKLGSWEYDVKTEEVYWSDQTYRITGMESRKKMKLQDYLDTVHPEDLPQLRAAFNESFSDLKPYEVELRHIKSDGSLICTLTRGKPVIENGEIVKFVGSVLDVTEQRMLRDQLQIRQRMDSLGTLAGGIAHDFNNILVGIMGYIDMLKISSDNFSDDQSDYLSRAEKSCVRAANLIKQFQTLSDGALRNKTTVDLHSLFTEVFGLIIKTTDKLIEKDIAFPPESFFVSADPNELHQVFLNLATNSIHAIEEKGTGHGDFIRVYAEKFKVSRGDITGLNEGNYIHLSFIDSGAGMSEEVVKNAFDPMFSTKDKGTKKGQGLGLAMVYNIVTKIYLGHIYIDSKAGHGTTMHIYLPEALPGKQIEEKSGSDIIGGSETILVVDDDPIIVDLTQDFLTGIGYSVFTAHDGVEAVEKYTKKQENIDLVLLDLTMPQMSGQQVFENLLQINPAVKIIISSGHGQEYSREGILTKATGNISKPYTLNDLSESVRNALGNNEKP